MNTWIMGSLEFGVKVLDFYILELIFDLGVKRNMI